MTLYLILGGARSSKSSYAETLGHNEVFYIATAQAFDDEMRERIAKHQQERPAGWRTVEAPTGLTLGTLFSVKRKLLKLCYSTV